MEKSPVNNEPNGSDMLRVKMHELTRNVLWQYGEVFLTTSQQVELYGGGVVLDMVDYRHDRPDSLPIADISFVDQKAVVTFVKEDYEYVLDAICRPAGIDGHKAASFYIGAGMAPAVLHEFLARNQNYEMINDVYNHLLETPPKENLKERIMIQQGTSRDLPLLIDGLFENIMTSDDKRIIRTNLLRYGIGTLYRIMESSADDWSMWQKDDKDRAGYVMRLREACSHELADMIRAQHQMRMISKSLGRINGFNVTKFYDRIPEILIAGSTPMSSDEIDELNSILMSYPKE